MTTRRGFFAAVVAAFAGAPAVPALASAILPAASPAAILPTAASPAKDELDLWSLDIKKLIHRSCRLLGVLDSGETLSQNAMEEARYALGHMLDAWAAEGFTPSNERAICYGLARELAYQYGVPGPDVPRQPLWFVPRSAHDGLPRQ